MLRFVLRRSSLVTVMVALYLSLTGVVFAEEKEDACAVFLEECTQAIGQVYLRLSQCADLRNAKRDCGVEKGSCKISAQEARDACLFACNGRQCKRQCRAVYSTQKKRCRNVKDECISEAISEHRTQECEAARNQNWRRLLGTAKACKNYDSCLEETGAKAEDKE